MENEELRSTIEQIKAQVKAKPENKDKTDDEIDAMILDAFLKEYTEGGMTKEDLLGLAEEMGYEPTEEFLNEADNPAPGGEPAPGAEGGNPAPEGGEGGAPAPTAAEAEETKVIEPGQSPEEFKEKVDEIKEGGNPAPNPAPAAEGNEGGEPGNGGGEEPGDDEGDDEAAEREKASKLWNLNLNK